MRRVTGLYQTSIGKKIVVAVTGVLMILFLLGHMLGNFLVYEGPGEHGGEAKLNQYGYEHGIGRLDLLENRFVGMKSRGVYETPGGTILEEAHRAVESITMDREVMHLKDELMPRYAKLIYNGYWWSPEREAIQTLIDSTQTSVNGIVRLKLFKGNTYVADRKSDMDSLFDETIATFEDDAGAYDQKDAEGFIKLNALRLKIQARKK